MSKLNVNIICFGEMLWDLLPGGRQAGGAPFNVAVHLNNFELAPHLISRVGTDELGSELLDFVRQKQIDTQWIQLDPSQSTGIVNANLDDSSEVVYDIVQPVAWDYISSSPELKLLAREAAYFVYGSLIARQAPSKTCLNELLEDTGYKIFDVNLRPPHYDPQSIAHLLSKANMVKLNHHELAEITAWFEPVDGLKSQMKFIQEKFDLDKILVSLGEKGACLLAEGHFFEQTAFPIQVVDTIGSGDSFLASFIYKMISKVAFGEALAFACATGALVATRRGATPSLNQKMVQAFINQTK